MKLRRRLIKLIGLTLAFALALGVFTAAAVSPPEKMTPVGTLTAVKPAKSFSDVPSGAWYEVNLNTLVCAGGIDGFDDGSFRGDSGLQLCEFVKILMAILYPDSLTPWEDYAVGGEVTWYSKYVGGAEYVGLLDGVAVSKSSLEAPMDRYTMAVMACNAAALLGDGLEDSDSIEYLIGDYAEIPQKYREAVRKAYQAGILTGKDADGVFYGGDGLTRAEACTVTVRLFQKDVRVPHGMVDGLTFTQSGQKYCVAVELPWAWYGRYESENNITANNVLWFNFYCSASRNDYDGQAGLLFSVVVSDTEEDFPSQTYVGNLNGQYIYIYYPSDVQFDPENAVSAREYADLYQDLSESVFVYASLR